MKRSQKDDRDLVVATLAAVVSILLTAWVWVWAGLLFFILILFTLIVSEIIARKKES